MSEWFHLVVDLQEKQPAYVNIDVLYCTVCVKTGIPDLNLRGFWRTVSTGKQMEFLRLQGQSLPVFQYPVLQSIGTPVNVFGLRYYCMLLADTAILSSPWKDWLTDCLPG